MAWDFSFSVSGENFRPSLVPFAFTEQEDIGAIARRGPFKGTPLTRGYASYQVPPHVPHQQRLKHLADLFEPMLSSLREAGATEWEVSIGRYYYAQCNETFSPDELKQLVRLNCPLCYSAYPVSEVEETELRRRFGYPIHPPPSADK